MRTIPILLLCSLIQAGETTKTPNPLEGLPSIEQLSLQKLTAVANHYPNSNEIDQQRIFTELHKPSLIQLDLDPNATPTPLVLRLFGPYEGLVLQDEGGPAVGDLKGLVAHLTKDADSDRAKADALFFFVRDVVKDWWYPAQGYDLTVSDLNVLIWGFGYGYCYDLGRLMAGLWAEAGLRSRIVGWPQHTVAEVYHDDAWHLYDLQHRSFYEKPDGQVAAFTELKADGSLFHQNLNKYGLDAIGYPPHHMEHWYSIANPNFQDSSEETDYWQAERDFTINLRKGELLDITYAQPGPAYSPDSWVVYYGLDTNRKQSPYPAKGILEYAPHRFNKGPMPWEATTSPFGQKAWTVKMKTPFMFTEGMITLPETEAQLEAWVKVYGRTLYLGGMPHGKVHLSDHIAGANEFELIVQGKQGQDAETLKLGEAYIRTLINISPIGLPRLRPGTNKIPFRFKTGGGVMVLWYREHAPDLQITGFEMVPEHPKVGQDAELIYTITNKGSGKSQPTSLTVHNNVTAFLSETTKKVGVQTLGPIEPGKSRKVQVYWRADTAMTWYGQNPYVQLLDAWLDMEKDTPDYRRDNNRRQDYVLLRDENGALPEIPGYRPLP